MTDWSIDQGKEVRLSAAEKMVVSGPQPVAYNQTRFDNAAARYQHLYKPQPALPVEKAEKRPQKICGLTKAWFIVLVALVVLIAAVTGTIGALVAVKTHSSTPSNSQDTTSCDSKSTPNNCPPTSTTTSSTTTATHSADTSNPNTITPNIINLGNCPFINGTEYISTSNGQPYVKICGTYWNEGDLYQPHATSFDDCINACGKYNDQKRQQQPLAAGTSATECHAVGWKTSSGSCWLKSGTMVTAGISADAADVQSAFLRDHWSDF